MKYNYKMRAKNLRFFCQSDRSLRTRTLRGFLQLYLSRFFRPKLRMLPPPKPPPMPPIRAPMPRILPLVMALVSCCIASKDLSRRFTSTTSRPQPAAMRRLREALRIWGFSRSFTVMDWMMALLCSICFSSIWLASNPLPRLPGSMEAIWLRSPIFCSCSS